MVNTPSSSRLVRHHRPYRAAASAGRAAIIQQQLNAHPYRNTTTPNNITTEGASLSSSISSLSSSPSSSRQRTRGNSNTNSRRSSSSSSNSNINKRDYYIVDYLCGERNDSKGKKEYEVKWQGYKETTWEPERYDTRARYDTGSIPLHHRDT